MKKRGGVPLISAVLIIAFIVALILLGTELTWDLFFTGENTTKVNYSLVENDSDLEQNGSSIEDHPPEIKNIPSQSIVSGASFTSFDLDDYVTEIDNDNIIWTYSGNFKIIVSINSNNRVTLDYPIDFVGNETITFIATDDTERRLSDSDTASFGIREGTQNSVPVVSEIPNQSIDEGENFTSFDLDDYVTDADEDDVLKWNYSGNSKIVVSIDEDNVVNLSYFGGFIGMENITFVVTDSGGLSDSDVVKFEIIDVIIDNKPKGSYPRLMILHYQTEEISINNAEELSRYDLLIFSESLPRMKPEVIDEIKALNSETIVLGYMSAEEVNVRDYNNPVWEGVSDCNGRLACLIYKNMPDEHWLYDIEGNHLWSWKYEDTITTYTFNPSEDCPEHNGKRFNDWYAEFIKENYPNLEKVDGLMVDNVFEGISFLETGPWWGQQNIDLNYNGLDDEEPGSEMDASWKAGMDILMRNFRNEFGSDFILNCNGQNTQQSFCNGRFYENFAYNRGWDGDILQKDYGYLKWDESHYGDSVQASSTWYCDYSNFRRMRFGIGTALLGDGYFECDTDEMTSWYDEYAVDINTGKPDKNKKGYLGEPKGGYQILENGVYRRDFDNGIVLVNPPMPKGYPQTINLEKEYRKIKGVQDPAFNTGETVNSVWLRDGDGMVLINVLE